jgi:hypothetical protein
LKAENIKSNDSQSVSKSAQFGGASLGTISIVDWNLHNREVLIQGMKRHFRLNVEAPGENGKVFDETAAEYSIST